LYEGPGKKEPVIPLGFLEGQSFYSPHFLIPPQFEQTLAGLPCPHCEFTLFSLKGNARFYQFDCGTNLGSRGLFFLSGGHPIYRLTTLH